MPWKILELTKSDRGGYHVRGENTEAVPAEPFSWHVSDLTSERYVVHEDAPPEVAAAVAAAKAPRAPVTPPSAPPSKLVRIDSADRLYVVRAGDGVSCRGFDSAERWIAGVAEWSGTWRFPVTIGTAEHFAEYERMMEIGARHAARMGTQCPVDLTPQLEGLEGARVEVVDVYGERRRFIVGKSTGWAPCHLEIARRTSSGGAAVTGAPFQSVRVVERGVR